MAVALSKENFLLHKLHSLSGIVPVGFYMAQHLTLNSFSFGGEAYFDGVIDFFEGMPKHFLLALEVLAIWLPLLFHSVYGFFITSRAKPNYIGTRYGWSQNRMYTLQRWSGIIIFAFLLMHISTTTVAKYIANDASVIKYAAWHQKMSNPIWLVVYMLGVITSAYHLGYGVWNFCIRWGITISERAQEKVQKVAFGVFVGLTLIGWVALFGFLMHKPAKPAAEVVVTASR
ncbi:succinate dehydrogenase [bacterium]|nr:MAG: succinate dehydrogenase [bacterium]